MTEDHENQYNEAWIQNELETKGILKAPEEGAVLFADDLVNAWKNFNQTNSNIGLIINGWVIDRTHAFYNQKFSSTTFLNCKFIGTLHMLGTYFNQLKFHNCFFSVVELSHAKIDGCPDPIHWSTSCESSTGFSSCHLVANSTGVM